MPKYLCVYITLLKIKLRLCKKVTYRGPDDENKQNILL